MLAWSGVINATHFLKGGVNTDKPAVELSSGRTYAVPDCSIASDSYVVTFNIGTLDARGLI